MRRGALAILLLCAGCRQLLGIDDPSVSSIAADASTDTPDAPVDTAAGTFCVGDAPYVVCMSQPGPLVIADGTVIDTTTDARCIPASAGGWQSPTQRPACFIVGSTITIGAVDVIGSQPLVIAATETITVTGKIDVASHRSTDRLGPGSPWDGCEAFVNTPGSSGMGAGGAAGASFGGKGGEGGNGAVQNGRGKPPPPLATPTILHAGCAGQTGGAGTGAAAVGGAGGGALYLVAATSISLGTGAHLNASGAGADPTAPHGGGGGGGSGGMLVLWAQAIQVANGVRIVANGGGGAGGTQVGSGGGGGETNPVNGLGGGLGGPATGAAGNGGDGGSLSVPSVNGGDASLAGGGGGGGGGGAVGYIQANRALGGMVSPVPNIVP